MICRPVIAALALAASFSVIPGVALAQTPADFPGRATGYADVPAIAVGAAWYPEHWPESRWETDLKLMKATGFNTVRLAEFAWSRMEPEEGKFDFAWLDRAIAAAQRHGFMVVLGTPSAAPPAWLTQKYPDTLRVDENGRRAGHGGRRHFSFASKRYRELSRRIAVEMTKRYGHHPAVVGWQIDNEVGPASFDAESVAAWHAFLKARYGTIDELNRRWTTQYWSQFYNDFDQVPLHQTGQQNPGLLLDFRHFTTATWTDFIQNQASAMRPLIDSRSFITTNTMYWNAGFDHFVLHRDLDIASWDNYIPNGRPDWVSNGANHDLVRGYKQRSFWLMETQAGHVDWGTINRALDPGQVREMGWQAVAHGADAVLYWQWRPAANGQETYYGTVLGQDGKPNLIQPEIAKMSTEMTGAAALLADTQPTAQVGMIYSFDSRWALDLQPHNKEYDPIKAFTDFYRPLRVQSQGVHVLAPDADFSAYPLVVAPHINVITAAQAKHLEAYVRGGGHLVLGARSGMKDDANALWPERQPGPLAALLGARVAQYYALDEDVGITGTINGKASLWAEAIEPSARDVRTLATYRDAGGWLDGKPAIVTRKVGRGSITYVGALLDPETMASLATSLLADAKITPIIAGAHPDFEIAERAGGGKRVLIAINHGDVAHPLALPAGARPVSGDWANGSVAAHGVALFELAAKAR
ncbi:beta-galactosidase [Hephaestia sp. GCM10023244]|uniref:beta-galactosidase n=1 Tax=Hephaestia sp. GCM10023244 TaxID=3252641 RepID=UPI00257406C2|nr:beta-galactosidase [Hephaestia sp. MAHUQ-44]